MKKKEKRDSPKGDRRRRLLVSAEKKEVDSPKGDRRRIPFFTEKKKKKIGREYPTRLRGYPAGPRTIFFDKKKRKIVFFDVDTQYDFMNPGGKLYVKGARRIIPNLRRLTAFARKEGIPIVASIDVHSKDDPEFRNFPPHCISGTRGAGKIKGTSLRNAVVLSRKRLSVSGLRNLLDEKGQVVVQKNTFDAFSNPSLKEILCGVEDAYIYGVATDYCVRAAAIGLRNLGIRTYLVKDAVRAVDSKTGREALREMKGRGVKFITAAKTLESLGR